MRVLKVENGVLQLSEAFSVDAEWVAGKKLPEYLKTNQRQVFGQVFGQENVDARMTEAHAACVAAYPKAAEAVPAAPATKAEKAEKKG